MKNQQQPAGKFPQTFRFSVPRNKGRELDYYEIVLKSLTFEMNRVYCVEDVDGEILEDKPQSNRVKFMVRTSDNSIKLTPGPSQMKEYFSREDLEIISKFQDILNRLLGE